MCVTNSDAWLRVTATRLITRKESLQQPILTDFVFTRFPILAVKLASIETYDKNVSTMKWPKLIAKYG